MKTRESRPIENGHDGNPSLPPVFAPSNGKAAHNVRIYGQM